MSMAKIKVAPPKLPRRPARKEGGAPGEGFLDLLHPVQQPHHAVHGENGPAHPLGVGSRVPLSYLGTVAVIALLSAPEGVSLPVWTAYQLMGGGLLMGAIFFATDPATSPSGR